jgi:hypothetical protein
MIPFLYMIFLLCSRVMASSRRILFPLFLFSNWEDEGDGRQGSCHVLSRVRLEEGRARVH